MSALHQALLGLLDTWQMRAAFSRTTYGSVIDELDAVLAAHPDPTAEVDGLRAKERESFQKYVDANEARIEAQAALSRVEALADEWGETWHGATLRAAIREVQK